MTRIALALAAAFTLVAAAPALAGPSCKDCPMHKGEAAAPAKAEGKDAVAKCACGMDPKTCGCAGKCACGAPHDHSKQDAKKPEKKS